MNKLIPFTPDFGHSDGSTEHSVEEYCLISRRIPPPLGALLLLDDLRSRRRDRLLTITALLRLLRGRLAHALPALSREFFPAQSLESVSPALRSLVRMRSLAADGKRVRLREALKCWSKTGDSTNEVEVLSLRRACVREGSTAWERLLSQELLLRSGAHEDWLYHELRWLYHQMHRRKLGVLQSADNHRIRAREVGVFFDPAQIRQEPRWSLARVRNLLQLMPSGLPLALVKRFLAGGAWELRLPLEAWPHMSPLLSMLGAGTNHLELPLGSWPCTLPDCGQHPGTLVLYRRDEAPLRHHELEEVCAAGWQVIVLCDEDAAPGNLPLLESGIHRGRLHLSGVSRNADSRVLPLKDYMRRVERRYIEEVLSLHAGVKTRACASLCITRQTLYSKLSNTEPRAAESGEVGR